MLGETKCSSSVSFIFGICDFSVCHLRELEGDTETLLALKTCKIAAILDIHAVALHIINITKIINFTKLNRSPILNLLFSYLML